MGEGRGGEGGEERGGRGGKGGKGKGREGREGTCEMVDVRYGVVARYRGKGVEVWSIS